MKNNRFVRIDCDTLMYTAYVDGKQVNSIQSDQPLAAGFVERFRVHTDDVMKMIDGEESDEDREKRILQQVLDRAEKLDW